MNALIASAAEILKFETALLLLVTAGLLVLAKIVSDLRCEVRGLRGQTAPEPQPLSTRAAPPHAMPSDEIPADVFTAIASAVYCTLDGNHRIVSVSPAESLAWSREGRRSIFRSHTFR
jgi:hypothetical protein